MTSKKSTSAEHERATIEPLPRDATPDPIPVELEVRPEARAALEAIKSNALPPRTESGLIHYVIAQHGTLKAALKSGFEADGARLVESVPIARLTEECQVSALRNGKITPPINVAEFWDGAHEAVYSGPFLCALGETCAPLVIRVREGVLTLRWA